jgi:hypothetical protein
MRRKKRNKNLLHVKILYFSKFENDYKSHRVTFTVAEFILSITAPCSCQDLSGSEKNGSCSGDALKLILKADAVAESCASNMSHSLIIAASADTSSVRSIDFVGC